jgi:hypothetical protein
MNDREASKAGGGTVRRRNTKPSNGGNKPPGKEAKPPAADVSRLQLHLPKSVVKRLGVHCAMVGASWSAEATRILRSYLAQHGQGRELFKDDPVAIESSESGGGPESSAGRNRPDQRSELSPDDQESA